MMIDDLIVAQLSKKPAYSSKDFGAGNKVGRRLNVASFNNLLLVSDGFVYSLYESVGGDVRKKWTKTLHDEYSIPAFVSGYVYEWDSVYDLDGNLVAHFQGDDLGSRGWGIHFSDGCFCLVRKRIDRESGDSIFSYTAYSLASGGIVGRLEIGKGGGIFRSGKIYQRGFDSDGRIYLECIDFFSGKSSWSVDLSDFYVGSTYSKNSSLSEGNFVGDLIILSCNFSILEIDVHEGCIKSSHDFNSIFELCFGHEIYFKKVVNGHVNGNFVFLSLVDSSGDNHIFSYERLSRRVLWNKSGSIRTLMAVFRGYILLEQDGCLVVCRILDGFELWRSSKIFPVSSFSIFDGGVYFYDVLDCKLGLYVPADSSSQPKSITAQDLTVSLEALGKKTKPANKLLKKLVALFSDVLSASAGQERCAEAESLHNQLLKDDQKLGLVFAEVFLKAWPQLDSDLEFLDSYFAELLANLVNSNMTPSFAALDRAMKKGAGGYAMSSMLELAVRTGNKKAAAWIEECMGAQDELVFATAVRLGEGIEL